MPNDELVPNVGVQPEAPTVVEPIYQEQSAEDRLAEEQQLEQDVQYQLSIGEKKRVVDYIIKAVDDCEAARSDWKKIRKECLDLLEGRRELKSDPWPNCSNISVMAVPMHSRLMHAKLLPAVWNDNLVHWQPVSADDVRNIENVKKFMRWTIRRELKCDDLVDDIVSNLIDNGTVAIKIRWGTEYRYVRDKYATERFKYKQIAHQRVFLEDVPIDDVYLPYLWKGEEDSEFIGQNIWWRLPDIQNLKDTKILPISDEDMKNIEEAIDKSLPRDDINKEKAKAEGTQPFNVNKYSKPVRSIEFYTKWPINGEMIDSVFLIDYNSRTYMSGKPLVAVSPIGRRPWVIGQFLRRTGRPYGVSLIEVIRGLAKELDAIHNQRIDAGTITIAPFGFYRAASSFKPEKVQIGPGLMIPVDDIKDVSVTQFQGNFISSFQEEKIIIEYIEKLTATSAYQMGRESDIVKSRATATGTMAIIAQGEQAYTILGLRCQRIISRMLTKILQMYQCHMPDGFARRIVGDDEGKLLFPNGLTPEEIDGGYDAYMVLDSTAGNEALERQTNAALVDMAPTLMALAKDPRGYEIAREFLVSIGKIEVEKYLGPKPKANPTGQSIPMGAGMGPIAQNRQAPVRPV